jgi:hypothetical protein
MRLEVALVHAALLLASGAVSATQSVVAGGCDCSPEVSNANAITISNCAKLWSNNQCTLKEEGTSGNTKFYNDVQNKVLFRLNPIDAPKTIIVKGTFDENELGSAIAALGNEQNVDFIASTLILYHENAQTISKYWGAGTPMVFRSPASTAVIKNKCFYAQNIANTSNFYLNFNEDNYPCDAWKAIK